jgi:hypothetical protein
MVQVRAGTGVDVPTPYKITLGSCFCCHLARGVSKPILNVVCICQQFHSMLIFTDF